MRGFRKGVADILRGIANRPPVLWAALGGVVSGLGGQVEALKPYEGIGMIVIPVIFGGIASRFTVGAETGGILAVAAKESPAATPEAKRRAEAVLKMPNVR